MDNRREFIKKATALAAGMGLSHAFPASIQKALAIDPRPGSTWLDAEHVVILMQENRSFDHVFGSLQGVRGFNDPRAIRLPDGDPVWLQKDAAGNAYPPFHLDIHGTKSTWTGALPHSWGSQVDARNNGKHDQWLMAKRSGKKEYADAPLTMGYYNRKDLPFYYSLADAFTVCDQNFCSSLTGTTPNRLYLWTGTIRGKKEDAAYAHVRNKEVNYDAEADWNTFPEKLEDHNISWKIYQNELSLPSGLEKEEEAWLANFTDNPMEWFTQYHVRAGLSKEEFEKLSPREKSLHTKAFTTNHNDPSYRQLDNFHYTENGEQRTVQIPKGDVLHQFREDVGKGQLPAVSWVVAPENFSDHPDAPWYGAWYVSEVMDILTKDPKIWATTIFVLCYDENDGYFDHVPPFVPPNPHTPGSGLVSPGLDTTAEHVTLEEELNHQPPAPDPRASPIGLGFRVPLVIASPWSRGGHVNSQVFDHTSVIRMMERLFSHRLGKKIEETNISSWRRAICGDLSSVFQRYDGKSTPLPTFLKQDQVIRDINEAQFKQPPAGYATPHLPQQEKGIRPACPLPYELYADGRLDPDKKAVEIKFRAGNTIFGKAAAGAPFIVYDRNRNRHYTLLPGTQLRDRWPLDEWDNAHYHLAVYGPNGFFREFKGNNNDPEWSLIVEYETTANKRQFTGNLLLNLVNRNNTHPQKILLRDNAYKNPDRIIKLAASVRLQTQPLDLTKSFGWYDFTITVAGNETFSQRYAGHVETGTLSFTDPLMGDHNG